MLTNFYPIPITSRSKEHTWQHFLAYINRRWQDKHSHTPVTHPPQAESFIGQWQDLFNHQLAHQPAILKTCNHGIRIEQTGSLGELRLYGKMGILAGGDIDICLYTDHWQQVIQTNARHHIELNCTDDSGHTSWQLYSDTENQTGTSAFNYHGQPTDKPKQTVTTAEIDTLQLQQMWASLIHVHQFYDMLSLFKLNLHDAITLMQDKWTFPLGSNQLIGVLHQCQREQIKTKILAGNRGIVHSIKAPIEQVCSSGKQIEVTGNNFLCQLEQQAISETWLVKRATRQGLHHSIEAFDQQGRLILQLQEHLDGGKTESQQWLRCLGRVGIIAIP